MRNQKRKISVRVIALMLVMAFAFALASTDMDYRATSRSVQSAGTRFSDVPTTHWAYSDIEALANGGLVNGVGNGMFSPDTKFTIAQMAQIIANAQGQSKKAGAGEFWYTPAVQHCLDIGCLPNFGAANSKSYDEECSRELAVYMFVTGLGIPAGKTPSGAVTAEYIPDYALIDGAYKSAVLDAYRYGLLNGVDSSHTFNPKKGLARCEACAILNRAGYTTAATTPVKSDEAKSEYDIINEIMALGVFEERKLADYELTGGRMYLIAKDRKYGNISVEYRKDADEFVIDASEIKDELIYDADYNILDENGNVFSKSSENRAYDSNGKFMPPSGLSYTSRQLVKKLLNIILPTEGDKAYDTLMDVLTPPHVYAPTFDKPGAVKWFDNRCVIITTGDDGGYQIDFRKANSTTYYNYYMSQPMADVHRGYDYHVIGSDGFISYEKAYELNKR